MIRYEDEKDLQRKIAVWLNKQGFSFDVVAQNFDLIDTVAKVYIEVKPDHFSPAQIIYAIAKGTIARVKYIGLATATELRIFKAPAMELMKEFARSIDPTLQRSPSSVDTTEWNERAFQLLGECHILHDYKGKLNLKESKREIFIDDENLEHFTKIFEKYRINPIKFITYIADLHSKHQSIVVNDDGWIININTGKFFTNVTTKKKETFIEYEINVDKIYDFDYKPIKDARDKVLLESLRVKSNDTRDVLHQFDRLESIQSRHARGRFFTKDVINKEITEIVKGINPDYIIEPYVGAGSLIEAIVDLYPGVGNDINTDFINMLRKKHQGKKWFFTNIDMFTTLTMDLITAFKIPTDGNLLILTNPPFGTSMTNKLQSKKNEIAADKKSRKKKIDYGDIGDKYGRGDLVLPAIGRMIEIIKMHGSGYIATFAPAGVYCGRDRYNKVLNALLKDFEFISGDIFSGKKFNSVSKDKPIAFTIWRYSPDTNTNIESLTFMSDDKRIGLKKSNLLRTGWRYRDGSLYVNETSDDALWVFRSSYFSEPYPKIIGINIQDGFGAEVSRDNVKIDLGIPNVPSELIYALWSTVVGTRSLSKHPIYMDNAYVHLPDFNRLESMEIVALAVISTLITALKSNYCKDRIGFTGMDRAFKFGNERLTNGALHLLTDHGAVLIGDKPIIDIFNELKNEPDPAKIDDGYQASIKKEIATRLNAIGYWDYIPVPMQFGEELDDD